MAAEGNWSRKTLSRRTVPDEDQVLERKDKHQHDPTCSSPKPNGPKQMHKSQHHGFWVVIGKIHATYIVKGVKPPGLRGAGANLDFRVQL